MIGTEAIAEFLINSEETKVVSTILYITLIRLFLGKKKKKKKTFGIGWSSVMLQPEFKLRGNVTVCEELNLLDLISVYK